MRADHPAITWARFILVALLSAAPVRAAHYYVSNVGDDANPGSISAPFRTLGRGVRDLQPGDTLILRAGTYTGSSQLRHIPSGESWARPVTIMAHEGERPIIIPEAKETVLYITGTKYVIIDGLVVDAKGGHDGIKITYYTGGMQAHHIRIQNCEVKNASNQGLLVAGEGNEFINLDVHDNGTTGFHHGIYLSAEGNLIDGGKYYRNAGWGVHVYPKATNTLVRNIRSFENRATGLGLVWGSNNVAYNNIVYSNGSGIHLSGDSPRCYNNTVYANQGEGLSIANADNGPSGTRKADVRNNIVYQNESGIRDYATGTGTILSHNLEADPGFVDPATGNFHLQPDSPAIDKGADLRSQCVTADFEGDARPQDKAFDIGADEFTPATTRAKDAVGAHTSNPRHFSDGRSTGVVLGIDGTAFSINGKKTFLGASYYGALGAPDEFIERDLDDLQALGFNWIRVFAVWDAFDNNVSAVDTTGNAREPFLSKLKTVVTAAEKRGIIVDVTLARMSCLPNQKAHLRAVETLAKALKGCRNVYFDLANERDQQYEAVYVSYADESFARSREGDRPASLGDSFRGSH